MFELLKEPVIDTLKVLPILLLVYLLVSYFEHNSHRYGNFFKKAKKFGPVIGGLSGSIPQCGFSVSMTDLYSKKQITLGTLIAVFIATSDEAIPLMLSNTAYILPMLNMIVIKLVYAIIFGYIIDAIMTIARKKRENHMEALTEKHSHEVCECGHEEHDHEHTNHCCADNIFLDAIKHTLQIALFVFIINLLFSILTMCTEFDFAFINSVNKFLQPLISALIGLIPNCAGSVLLVELYMAGGITYGALLAGLASGAGVGILMLFKNNKKAIWQNLLILGLIYILGIILGEIITLIGLVL